MYLVPLIMLSDIPNIETYRGFASENRLIYICRLLKDQNHVATADDGWWINVKNTFRKVASREISNAAIQATFEGQNLEVVSDREGYVYIDMDVSISLESEESWKSIVLSGKHRSFSGEVVVPSEKAQYGIISDIDDTVLVTEVHAPFRMIINSLFKNPYQRQSFEGMDTYFKMLHNGINPVFYLSNSPWNLYQNIQQFLSLNNMPKGPILLRDFGMHFPVKPHAYVRHKEINIELILSVYPDLPFILIGDATQEDAIIYSHLKEKYPQRIKEIYIRETKNHFKTHQLKERINNKEKEIKFFKDYFSLLKDIQ